MAGLGGMGVGTGPFGLGTPPTAAIPPTGAWGSRYIHPTKKAYEQDTITKQLQQMPGLRQRVLLTMLTTKGSSTVLPLFGITVPRKITSSFEREVESRVREAMLQYTETEKVMRINAVLVSQVTTGRINIILSYTDLTTNEDEVLPIGSLG